ncbi:hypothetical protein Ae201684_010936 [Aphanomyces euteiches]|uniref:EF-hand domain-containing protein n=1 Tax=Aphanomyces euteiches TaxID=100861 RepID=A0A6G0WWY3_9STRA|nr:hypothetical protein Ae201684_010936 [Aphanomyces euteiches]
MGSRFSKGAIRRKIRPWIPTSWEELIVLERWAAMHKLMFVKDATMLKKWFKSIRQHDDSQSPMNDLFHFPVSVNDILAGFCLLQQAPTTRKFTFISNLLKIGDKCNKEEVLIAMCMAVRGISLLKGIPLPPEKALRVVVNGVYGNAHEFEWPYVVERLVIVPDVVYFLSDLDMVTVASLENLIADQREAMRELATIEYDIEVLRNKENSKFIVSRDRENFAANSPFYEILYPPDHQRDGVSNKREFIPHLQLKATMNLTIDVEVLMRLSTVQFQELLKAITNGAVTLSESEAGTILNDMPKDQFDKIACSDFIRWFKQWSTIQPRQALSKWQLAAHQMVEICASAISSWNKVVSSIQRQMNVEKSELLDQREEQPCENNAEMLEDSNISLLIHVGESNRSKKTYIRSDYSDPDEELECRIKFNVKSTDNDTVDAAPLDVLDQMHLDDDQILETGFPMAFSLEFFLRKDITDESALALTKHLELLLNDYMIVDAMSFIWQKATVNLIYGCRPHSFDAVQNVASEKFYVRINLLSRRNHFAEIEAILHEELQSIIQSFQLTIKLSSSFQELLSYSWKALDLVNGCFNRNDPCHTTRMEDALFQSMDRNTDGEISLDEINCIQQSLGMPLVYSETSFLELVSQYSDATSINGITMRGSMLGNSLNETLCGTISIASSLKRELLSHLQILCSNSRWKDVWTKLGVFTSLQLADINLEMAFPSFYKCITFFFPDTTCSILRVPGWLAQVVHDIKDLLWDRHEQHPDPAKCKNIICAAQLSLQKFQMLSSLKSSQGSKDPKISLAMESLKKFIEAYFACENGVCGIQQAVLSNKSVELCVDLDHFVLPRNCTPKPE